MTTENEETQRAARIYLDYQKELLSLMQIADLVGGKQGQHLQQWALQAAEALFVVDSLKYKLLAGESIIRSCVTCHNPLPMPDIARDKNDCAACRGEQGADPDLSFYVLSA